MRIHDLKLVLVAALFFILTTCVGGGSHGTGGVEYRGTLYAASSGTRLGGLIPLTGVTITIGATGDFAVTDERGYYSIRTDWVDSEVEIFFDAAGLSAKYLVNGLPKDARRVTLDFTVDRTGNKVELLSLSIETGDSADSATSESNQSGSDASHNGASHAEQSSADSTPRSEGASSSTASRRSSDGSSGSSKVTICHNPDSKNPVTLVISVEALESHLAHGDTVGPCLGK